MTELNEKILKQVEFYFSEPNLRRDVFLKKAISDDQGECNFVETLRHIFPYFSQLLIIHYLLHISKERFVPISTLLKFNRLKALSTDPEVITEALKGSKVVEVSSCGTKLRSISELNPIDTSKERTLYAKGYPIGDVDVTIENIASI